jgi:hypothetical protein
MVVLAALPVALRLALMPFHPVPVPAGSDDFSYLLLGDTLAHLRLANPVHPMHRFFETDFVLQEPTYSSIFPLGQGIVLALGQITTGEPWAGVLFTSALFCALSYWMLRAWVTPVLALAGGLLAVMIFGPLNQWTNSYFGGGVSAVAGCLVFGTLPRIWRRDRIQGAEEGGSAGWTSKGILGSSVILGAGIGLQILSRPFESIVLAACVLAYFLPAMKSAGDRRKLAGVVAIAAIAGSPAVALTAFHNHAVTGRWTKLPYLESREQYGVPATFTFQPNPVPHRTLTREQDLDYRAQAIIHGDATETPRRYFARLWDRMHFYRFFVLPPLYVAWVAFLAQLRQGRYRWVLFTVTGFALATNFYPYFYPHYIAALSCVFLLMSVAGLDVLRGVPIAAQAVFLLCAAQFLFWYGVHAYRDEALLTRLAPYESPNFISWGDPEGRSDIRRQLSEAPGKQLVFVRYSPRHLFREWVHNAADIDSARIVWARDLGAAENEILRKYYPDRKAWRLEPDESPPELSPYTIATEAPEFTVAAPPESPSVQASPPAGKSAEGGESVGSVPELPDSGWLIKKRPFKKDP